MKKSLKFAILYASLKQTGLLHPQTTTGIILNG